MCIKISVKLVLSDYIFLTSRQFLLIYKKSCLAYVSFVLQYQIKPQSVSILLKSNNTLTQLY